MFGEYLPEQKTQVLKLQIRFHVSMFQNFKMDASRAHFWDFFLVLLTADKINLGLFLSVLPSAGEKNFDGVCFVSKTASYTYF